MTLAGCRSKSPGDLPFLHRIKNSLTEVERTPVNETQKTGIFAAVAAVAVLLAVLTRPVSVTKEEESGTANPVTAVQR